MHFLVLQKIRKREKEEENESSKIAQKNRGELRK